MIGVATKKEERRREFHFLILYILSKIDFIYAIHILLKQSENEAIFGL
jgi:hypothetical protein